MITRPKSIDEKGPKYHGTMEFNYKFIVPCKFLAWNFISVAWNLHGIKVKRVLTFPNRSLYYSRGV
jgi:hypothetical protein